MKKIIIASVLIVGLAAGFAYSHGNGRAGYGNNMMGSSYGMMGGGNGMMGRGNGMMGGGYGMMGGNGGEGNYYDCPGAASFGQGGWNSEPHQKFLEETVGLRKEMNDKRFDYMEAQRNPNTSREQLAEIEKEMIDLRTQLSAKAELLK
jgi:hypothetical protein